MRWMNAFKTDGGTVYAFGREITLAHLDNQLLVYLLEKILGSDWMDANLIGHACYDDINKVLIPANLDLTCRQDIVRAYTERWTDGLMASSNAYVLNKQVDVTKTTFTPVTWTDDVTDGV